MGDVGVGEGHRLLLLFLADEAPFSTVLPASVVVPSLLVSPSVSIDCI